MDDPKTGEPIVWEFLYLAFYSETGCSISLTVLNKRELESEGAPIV